VERLKRRYNSFAKRMKQTDGDELLEMFLTSITTAFDPHTNYMSKSTLENFDIQMRLGLEGIGAALQLTDGYTVATPGNWKDGDDVIIPLTIQDPEQLKQKYPKGFNAPKPYLRLTPQPNK
jgi:hypothetical protein